MQHICFVTALAPCLHIICSDPREELLLCYSLITQAPLHLSCSAGQAAAGSSLTLAPSPLAHEGSIPGSQHDLEEMQEPIRITLLRSPQRSVLNQPLLFQKTAWDAPSFRMDFVAAISQRRYTFLERCSLFRQDTTSCAVQLWRIMPKQFVPALGSHSSRAPAAPAQQLTAWGAGVSARSPLAQSRHDWLCKSLQLQECLSCRRLKAPTLQNTGKASNECLVFFQATKRTSKVSQGEKEQL